MAATETTMYFCLPWATSAGVVCYVWAVHARGIVAAGLVAALGCADAASLRGGDVPLHSGERGTVAAVHKGDEVVLRRPAGLSRIRLLGIWSPAPVLDLPWLAAAERRAQAFWTALGDQPVRAFLDPPGRDAYGRVLAYLQTDDRDLGLQMVACGLVLAYTEFRFSREADYLAAEARARAAGRGIWADPQARAMAQGLRQQWDALRAARNEPAPAPRE